MWPNAIPVLAYDTARVLDGGVFPRTDPFGAGLKAGLEQHPVHAEQRLAGPHTHIAGRTPRAPAVQRRLAPLRPGPDGALEFEGLFEPWDSRGLKS